MKILFVVESPGKIAKISKFLGKDYIVKASVGHFRDLDKNSMSIDFEKNFEPIYVITKADVVKNLRSAMKNVDMLYIASDKDFEGESIAQHLHDVLKPKKYKRLIFNSITKDAIINSIKNAGLINENLVHAQKARRILDRLYGYLISPILQQQLGGKLSAGRVQSIAAKIVIDKENEIEDFIKKNVNSTYFKIDGHFSGLKSNLYKLDDYIDEPIYNGEVAHIPLSKPPKQNAQVISFMKLCLKSIFTVHSVNDKIAIRNASPPFETSTLQQESHRKFGMSVDVTMKTAQKLYEGGYITYMRTDSIEISEEGHKEIKEIIESEYGIDYYQKNVYKNKSANAQEAHEAIRPTHPDLLSVENEIDDAYQIKLYKLIWQRTIASQMKPAKINITTIQIDISKYVTEKLNPYYYFQSQIEKIVFQGFMKVYVESVDDALDDDIIKDFNGKIPKVGDKLVMEEINAKQEYKRPPCRYSEASLVKTLKKLGIGRPSTYVNTIKTIMERKYIKIDNVQGINKQIVKFTIKSENKKQIMEIFEEQCNILLGKEQKKIIPTQLGITVNDFLVENFLDMMDYKFTAKMEAELDAISNGDKIWYEVIKKFYDKLMPIVTALSAKKGTYVSDDHLLGVDDEGNEIFAGKTKYGPAIKKKQGDKFTYVDIPDNLSIDTIKLSDAIKLLEYPITLGEYNNNDIILNKGRYGFYLSHNKENYAIGENSDIKLKDAIKIIKEKKSNNIAKFDLIENKKKISATVLNGKFGPYIQVIRGTNKKNYPIRRGHGIEVDKLTGDKILEIISSKKPIKSAGSKTSKKK